MGEAIFGAKRTAITRKVSPTLQACELTFVERRSIDIELAARQHQAYEIALTSLGLDVASLPAIAELPDSVFVEDPAVVVDEVAVIARLRTPSRRPEADDLANVLEQYRTVVRMREPAQLEGGDVMQVGRTLYVGISQRTNREGINQLADALMPFGYHIRPVNVHGCLHLKTACCYVGDGTVLVNREWIHEDALADLRMIDVPAAEPWGANVLRIGDTILTSAQCPVTTSLLERSGWRTRPIDISEPGKAEAGLTCMSLIFTRW